MGTRVVRLGLYGLPGAGKSTTTGFVTDYCRENDIPFRLIKLADPLYEAQAAVYSICGRPLEEFYVQDGELLNFLGTHMRKINPTVLLDRFDGRLQEETAGMGGHGGVVLCDDVRAPDAAFLASRDFHLVRIDADPEECARRRRERGDLTLGSAAHASESGLASIRADHVLVNRGTPGQLAAGVRALLAGLLA